MTVKPMLAAAITGAELGKQQYPKIIQPKLDGVRAVINNGYTQSRSGKQLPNWFVSNFMAVLNREFPAFHMIDGELIVGEPTDKAVCMNTTSGIMSYHGEPDFKYYVFDLVDPTQRYIDRYKVLANIIERVPAAYASRIVLVPNLEVRNAEQAMGAIAGFIGDGHEGAILRDPVGLYKHGRSTLKQGILLKYKDIQDDEAYVIGFDELHHNMNVATTSELGFTKRSSHKEAMIAGGKLGALVVWSPKWPSIFKIGTGFDDVARIDIWSKRDYYLYKPVTFKYLAAGIKMLPRHPVFKVWRPLTDQDTIEISLFTQMEKHAKEYERGQQ